ncbi:T-cell immunomodulatory protein-like [Limulus polyphemus]|uniref:T-cell immunomodulatory protein-like n=1 Tax=Limulus polyphemus TaxID=6850 RepID=A0ABM1TIN6_LIMPO|nr:T-cell immunomodulatory protein-like [Limulus polyphemus]XP_022255741.1 T-cell immunomodulatory protein-like [Limulus polyphemus]XP_022255742.1 T-cell immunomodulatory protein-like [Limulus polyphemus]XP_022255743.1 T-cell immunomodulatory protein-like [Limulus polyphemus]XP_022255744.1 T-cell immunomodulatory protein-like [Limulus polyphemus]XP_022255745.1 T-cell immunomodulatory protein-like [Limulus polyphemus]XP_022255746.1 T-cell immunomodulatory protein-like [Limulus polyphemus]XP_0
MWKESYVQGKEKISIFCHFTLFHINLLSVIMISFYIQPQVNCLKDISFDVFQSESDRYGILAAYGDFNSDKLTDVFVISNNGKSFEVLISYSIKPFLRRSRIVCSIDEGIITSVMPADFNGDSKMDILITVKIPDLYPELSIRVLWGNFDTVQCNTPIKITMKGQPLIMDYNNDMIADMFGEGEDGKRYYWLGSVSSNFTLQEAANPLNQPLRIPHSCAFLDLNGDMAADLLVTGQKKFEYWTSSVEGNFSYWKSVPNPQNVSKFGQSSFTDIDLDGSLEHVVPVCQDHSCKLGGIMVLNDNDEWQYWIRDFKQGDIQWSYSLPDDDSTPFDNLTLSLTLRVADFDMDGFPDFVTVLKRRSEGKEVRQTVVLRNTPCSGCLLGRTLEIIWKQGDLSKIPNPQLPAFYDIFEDGTMDLIISGKSEGSWKLYALQNTFDYDAYFIKVLVLNGRCYVSCPGERVPYGTNQPGPLIQYYTTRPNGSPQVSSAAQLSQSAHFSLQLPYVVFGLGQTPNFIDKLTVGIPGHRNSAVQKRVWTQIIPNSQMVVIPHPSDKPDKWINKLFVTPSRLVILTFAALLGTCGFIGLIIGALHWKERREDRREKLQEAHRFHFDAM